MCLFSSSEREKRRSQLSIGQAKGFSLAGPCEVDGVFLALGTLGGRGV